MNVIREEIRFHRTNQVYLYEFLRESFPDLSYRTYQKINKGKHFLEWVYGVINGVKVCCTAIFKRGFNNYRMGLFCVSPSFRNRAIGTRFYHFLVKQYQHLEWSASSSDSIQFYRKVGAIEGKTEKGVDGKEYTLFSSER